MYYRLLPTLTPIAQSEIDPNVLTAGYIDAKDIAQVIAYFGFSDVSPEFCLADHDNYRNLVDVFEDYVFGLINIVDVNNVYDTSDRMAFFFRKNLLLVANLYDEDGSTQDLFVSALKRYKPESVTLEKLIFGMLESTITKDAQGLKRFEAKISEMEEAIALGRVEKGLSVRIYEQKKRLLYLRSYYEQLVDLGEALEENENEIFEEDALHYFALLTAKANRLCDAVNVLTGELSQLRDALTSAMDYKLNHIMEIFTIISGVFLPLTLLVGWYGMNFKYMPELESVYGYPLFIVVCVVLAGGCLFWFKRKKWF